MVRSRKKPSKNIFVVAALIAAVAVGGYFVFKGKYDVRSSDDAVVAQINGTPVYSSEAEEQMYTMLRGATAASGFDKLDEQSKFFVVRELAAQKLILEEAYREGFENKQTVLDRVDAFKEGVIKEEFLAYLAKSAVTEDKVKDRYSKDSAQLNGRTQFIAKHILLKTEKEAKDVKNKLKSRSFEELAKSKSIDGKTAKNGGDLGPLISGGMIPEFEEAVAKLKDGAISAPVKTKFGWHIIKLVGKQPAEPAPYDQVKDVLAQALYQEEIKSYVKEVIDSADIEIIGSAKPSDTLSEE